MKYKHSFQTSPLVFPCENSSLVYSNPTTADNMTIPFFDETQQNSINPNEDRKSLRTRNFSCGSERDKQDNESTITVN